MTTEQAETEAVDALTALGLSTYGARTFVGLQKLGAATASEVAGVTEVPRSQVYGATDELEELGLVDVQEGSPKRYRPVEVEEARALLYARLESAGDDAFEYLESVRGECADEEGAREAIWTTAGRESVTSRITSLVGDAEERVLFATGERELIEGPVADALVTAAGRGVSVAVASADEGVRAVAADAGIEVLPVDEDAAPAISIGRALVTDDDTVLLSVLPTAEMPHVRAESAFWSAGTGFATILAALIGEQVV